MKSDEIKECGTTFRRILLYKCKKMLGLFICLFSNLRKQSRNTAFEEIFYCGTYFHTCMFEAGRENQN